MDKQKRQYLPIVISVGLAAVMSRLDIYIVNISLPTISRYYDVDIGVISQIVSYNLLFLTCSLLLAGKFADKFGIKKVYISGLAVFMGSSLLCALAPTITILTLCRCLEGIGGAMLMATSFAVIPKFLPSEITGWAYGTICIASMLGVAVGAPLGGMISGLFSWHGIFIINIPVGIITIILAIKTLPEEKISITAKGKFDILGALLSFISMFALLYAITNFKAMGGSSAVIISCFLVSAIFFAAFIVVERNASDPILDVSIFRNVRFSTAMAASALIFAVISGIRFIIPFFLELVQKENSMQAGVIYLLYPLASMTIGPLSGRASDQIKPRLLCAISMLLSTVGCLAFAFTLHVHSLIPVLIFLLWTGISFGGFFPPNNNLVMSMAPKGKHGQTSGIYNTIRSLSLAFGVCTFQLCFSAPAKGKTAGTPSLQLISEFQRSFLIGALMCFLALAITITLIMKRLGERHAKPSDLLAAAIFSDENAHLPENACPKDVEGPTS